MLEHFVRRVDDGVRGLKGDVTFPDLQHLSRGRGASAGLPAHAGFTRHTVESDRAGSGRLGALGSGRRKEAEKDGRKKEEMAGNRRAKERVAKAGSRKAKAKVCVRSTTSWVGLYGSPSESDFL